MQTKNEILTSISNLSLEEQKEFIVKKYEEAEAAFNLKEMIVYCEILVYNFDYFGYKFELPRLYNLVKDYDSTIQYMVLWMNNKEAVDILAMEPMPIIRLGIAYARKGEIDLAIQNLKLAIEILQNGLISSPNATEEWKLQKKRCLAMAKAQIGKIHFENQDYRVAYQWLIEAQNDCDYVDSIYYIANLAYGGFLGEKNIRGALAGFEELATYKIVDTPPRAYDESMICIVNANYNAGLIYATEPGYKNKKKAIQYLEQAKRLGYAITDEEIYNLTNNIIDDVPVELNSSRTETVNSQEKTKGCYVATCVYGSYDCPQVWTLRRYRDSVLAESVFGRLFIRLYYAISPTAVKCFGNFSWFHKLFKTPLDKLVQHLQKEGIEDTPCQNGKEV